jgi:hypothetical protein
MLFPNSIHRPENVVILGGHELYNDKVSEFELITEEFGDRREAQREIRRWAVAYRKSGFLTLRFSGNTSKISFTGKDKDGCFVYLKLDGTLGRPEAGKLNEIVPGAGIYDLLLAAERFSEANPDVIIFIPKTCDVEQIKAGARQYDKNCRINRYRNRWSIPCFPQDSE